jgi:hypothetical protein
MGTEPRAGTSPIVGAAAAVVLLELRPPCDAARHFGIGVRLLVRNKRGEQRELVALC